MKVRDARRRASPPPPSPWIGGRFASPFFVNEGEGAWRPDILVWMRDGQIVGQEVARPDAHVEALGKALRRAIESTGARPARVRVAGESFVAELRAVLGDDVAIEVAPTPEVDRLKEMFAGEGERGAVGTSPPTYTERGAITAETVASMFRAALRFHRQVPWDVVVDEDETLQLDCDALGWAGACVCIVGSLGESFGFLVFDSGDDYVAFRAFGAARQAGDGSSAPGVGLLALNYEKRRDLPPSMVREVERHRWPVAGADAYPVVIAMDKDGHRPVTARDVLRARVAADALARFFEAHADRWEELLDDDAPTVERYVFEDIPGRPAVTVSAPHPVWVDRHSEDLWLDEYYDALVEGGTSEESPELTRAMSICEAAIEAVRDYGAPALVDWTVSDVDQFLLTLMPRKFSWSREDSLGAPSALAGWFRWLGRSGRMPQGASLARHAEGLEEAFVAAMSDPANFGMARSVVAQIQQMGLPLNTPEEFNAALSRYSEMVERGEVKPILPELPPLSEEEMASLGVGRNDPCPCGSGKKYKKCHGA